MSTANNSQIDSIESLFVDLTPEEAQNIAGGGVIDFFKNGGKFILSKGEEGGNVLRTGYNETKKFFGGLF